MHITGFGTSFWNNDFFFIILSATAVILYCSNVQIATFCAVAVSYAGLFTSLYIRTHPNTFFFSSIDSYLSYFLFPVMIMHASLRKLSPSKQPARADGNKRFQQNKNRS